VTHRRWLWLLVLGTVGCAMPDPIPSAPRDTGQLNSPPDGGVRPDGTWKVIPESGLQGGDRGLHADAVSGPCAPGDAKVDGQCRPGDARTDAVTDGGSTDAIKARDSQTKDGKSKDVKPGD
jgi:hypothetical protein